MNMFTLDLHNPYRNDNSLEIRSLVLVICQIFDDDDDDIDGTTKQTKWWCTPPKTVSIFKNQLVCWPFNGTPNINKFILIQRLFSFCYCGSVRSGALIYDFNECVNFDRTSVNGGFISIVNQPTRDRCLFVESKD